MSRVNSVPRLAGGLTLVLTFFLCAAASAHARLERSEPKANSTLKQAPKSVELCSYYFRMKDGEPFAIAALWEIWERGDKLLETCTLLTTEANALLGGIHDRMPVMLRPEGYGLWLDRAM